jgi:hypothetical protein
MTGKYKIGDQDFATKKACLTFTQNLMNGMNPCQIRKGEEHYDYLMCLIEQHPKYEEKYGSGIECFSVERNPLNVKAKHLNLVRTDGSIVSISWNLCCKFESYSPPRRSALRSCKTGFVNEKRNKQHLSSAMRSAIKNDTMEFKNNQSVLKCRLCNTEDAPYHTDHVVPFQVIRDEFLKTCNLATPDSFDKCPVYYDEIFCEKDKVYADSWLAYHTKERTYFSVRK